jgi:hypothetical protein
VSRSCNLLQHDDEPLDGYLSGLCRPQLSIKWYKFYPKKRKKEKKSWSIKTSRMCQCTRKTVGKTRKNDQFWVFSTSFNTISNVLNFLGVVFGVSDHSPTHILSTLIFIKIHKSLTLTIVLCLILKVCMCISSCFLLWVIVIYKGFSFFQML